MFKPSLTLPGKHAKHGCSDQPLNGTEDISESALQSVGMHAPISGVAVHRWSVSLEAINKPALHTAYAHHTWMGLILQPEVPVYTFLVLTG